MIKGISRQVILVRPTEEKLYEQAIFILREDCKPVSEEALLREADRLVQTGGHSASRGTGPIWAGIGAVATGLIWLITTLF